MFCGGFFRERFWKTVLSDKLSSESSSGRTFGRTVLSDKVSLKSSLGRTSGETVLSNQVSSSSGMGCESLRGCSLEQALALHADITEDYHMMAITIISAQTIPTGCRHSPVTHTDSESDSDSSDSVFFTRTTKTSSSENTTSSLLGSSEMTTTETTATVATEADFDVEDTNKVKADVADDSKASEATNKDTVQDADKVIDKDTVQVADKVTDKDTVQVVDKVTDKVADTAKNQAADAKAVHDDEDQSWGSWNQRSWNKKQSDWQQSQEGRQLGQNAKKKLNKEMRELCRPVHVGSLAYVLPDKSKKSCLTWCNAVEHHLSVTGKPPAWSEFFLECRVCHRFHRNEQEWEEHYISKHSDESVYRQCLRRLKQWDTRECTAAEVESNVELIYGVGQNIGYGAKQVESDILEATGITNLAGFIDKRRNPDQRREG